MLSEAEIARYARHIVLPEIGGAGQQKLKAARVLIVGAGGLGAPIIQYLAAAGMGTLIVADDDVVSVSNLQRQVIHDSGRIGEPKVSSAAAAVARINPHVMVEPIGERLTGDNAGDAIARADIVVDGSDNFDTRYMLAALCEKRARPLVTGAVGRFDGSVTVLMPHAMGPNGKRNPRYTDIFPEPPPPGTVPSCAEAGIVGALTGVIGTLQAMEVIKIVTGAGTPLIGSLLLYDALAGRFETIRYGARD
jgi:molybdopterin/thiamine biosynthesis adenylyltransferase